MMGFFFATRSITMYMSSPVEEPGSRIMHEFICFERLTSQEPLP
jgi:hypothetical protein